MPQGLNHKYYQKIGTQLQEIWTKLCAIRFNQASKINPRREGLRI